MSTSMFAYGMASFMVNTLLYNYRDNVISCYRYHHSTLPRDNQFIVTIAQHYIPLPTFFIEEYCVYVYRYIV